MRLYPYSKIKTETLFELLLLARILATVCYFLLFSSVLSFIFGIVSEPMPYTDIGEGFTVSGTDNVPAVAFMISFLAAILTIFMYVVSGLCAAIVSFENQYVSKNKIGNII